MQELGNDEEEQALTLGAGGWRILLRVTLPKVRWGILSRGGHQCNARAMGEFGGGSRSVTSGHIRGRTNTIPLQVEILCERISESLSGSVRGGLDPDDLELALFTLIGKKLSRDRESRCA